MAVGTGSTARKKALHGAKEEMAECFQLPGEAVNFAHGHTYAGHPVACAAGIAVVEEVVEQGLDRKARALGEQEPGDRA